MSTSLLHPRPLPPITPSPHDPQDRSVLSTAAQNFVLFDISPPNRTLFSISLGVFSWNFGCVFWQLVPIKHPLLASGHLEKPGARTTPSRMIKGSSLHTPRTNPWKRTKRENRVNIWAGEGNKKANCWASPSLARPP